MENKQETPEEAAERLYPDNGFEDDLYCDEGKIFRESWLAGAKWQQERSYSEEDIKNAFLDGWQLRDGDLPFPKAKKKWFNELKNK
jgi:hypothetical protein